MVDLHAHGVATENGDGGYLGIQGPLANLRHEVARGTIANILTEQVDRAYVFNIGTVL